MNTRSLDAPQNAHLTPESLRFPVLSTERYLTAVNKTADQIRKQLQPPAINSYTSQIVSPFPRWFTVGVAVALAAVMLFSFVISAGKQAASPWSSVPQASAKPVPGQHGKLNVNFQFAGEGAADSAFGMDGAMTS